MRRLNITVKTAGQNVVKQLNEAGYKKTSQWLVLLINVIWI